jgi:hypothetical protein
MNDLQEHVSPYPPFQPPPMPQNAKEAHFILIIAMITWVVGLVLVLRMGRQSK